MVSAMLWMLPDFLKTDPSKNCFHRIAILIPATTPKPLHWQTIIVNCKVKTKSVSSSNNHTNLNGKIKSKSHSRHSTKPFFKLEKKNDKADEENIIILYILQTKTKDERMRRFNVNGQAKQNKKKKTYK